MKQLSYTIFLSCIVLCIGALDVISFGTMGAHLHFSWLFFYALGTTNGVGLPLIISSWMALLSSFAAYSIVGIDCIVMIPGLALSRMLTKSMHTFFLVTCATVMVCFSAHLFIIDYWIFDKAAHQLSISFLAAHFLVAIIMIYLLKR